MDIIMVTRGAAAAILMDIVEGAVVVGCWAARRAFWAGMIDGVLRMIAAVIMVARRLLSMVGMDTIMDTTVITVTMGIMGIMGTTDIMDTN